MNILFSAFVCLSRIVMLLNMNETVTIVLSVIVAAASAAAGWFAGVKNGRTKVEKRASEQTEKLSVQLEQERLQAAGAMRQAAEDRVKAQELASQLEYVKEQLTIAQSAEKERVERERKETLDRAEENNAQQIKSTYDIGKVLSALSPIKDNLDSLKKRVTSIEEGRKSEMGALGEQLKGLARQQQMLSSQTQTLASALKDNKVRGAWGEAQLKNIVQSAGLIEHVDFDVQVVVEGDEGVMRRPDMVIHLPGGKTIPIDAKVPYSYFQQACEISDYASADELARKNELLKEHAKALRAHIKELGERAYWNALPHVPDFVIAFIPNESLLQAALEVEPSLMDEAFAAKVALTSPVTLWAVLKSVAYAWQQQSLTDDAQQLFDLSRELYGRFAKLGDHASKLGRSITSTVKAYNAFAASLESRVLSTARKMQAIDASTLIEPVEQIGIEKGDIRQLAAPELTENDAENSAENNKENRAIL